MDLLYAYVVLNNYELQDIVFMFILALQLSNSLCLLFGGQIILLCCGTLNGRDRCPLGIYIY